MKKIGYSLVGICLLLAFTIYHFKTKPPQMHIQKAELTKEEKNILELIESQEENEQTIFDFQVDKRIKAIQTNVYELKNGKWSRIAGGGGSQLQDVKGRIAFSSENIAKGCRTAIQRGKNTGVDSYTTEISKEQEKMGRMTSYLTGVKEITYEEEIPLIIQVQTAKNGIIGGEVDSFYHPEIYSKYGYEHVYAITVRFSKKSVGELSGMIKK